MPDFDLFALRPGATGDAPAGAPALGPAPSPLVIASDVMAGRRARRLGASAAVTTILHIGFAILFVAAWRSMVRDVAAPPEPIAVEVVDKMPGEVAKPASKPAEKPAPPPPALQAKADPIAPPAAPPAATPSAPARPSALDEAMKPELAEPPPEAKAAAAQDEVNQAGNASTTPAKADAAPRGTPDAAKPPQEAAPSPAAPAVLTAGAAETSVPAAAPTPAQSKPPTAGDPTPATRQARDLAAVLPMSGLPMPATFRAALSAAGASANADYRGSVFGALSRAREAVDEEARAKRLTGQVVLAIRLTDTGAIDSLTVVQSSGRADADAFAVAMVRRAAPFPPPPPGTSRIFTPAVTFGPS